MRSQPRAILLFALALGACPDDAQFASNCKTADDCPVGSLCLINPKDQSGLCACRTDEACAEGEICNSQHICQKRSGCRSNLDCDMAKYCDLGTGDCIDRVGCGADVHCLPGTVCDETMGRCVSGCLDSADCPLYQPCERPQGVVRGACMPGRCGDKSFCARGSTCTNGMCVVDNNPSHCAVCDGSNGSCPNPNDYCLINSGYDPGRPERGSEFFCGVECNPQIDNCPNGYTCNTIRLVTFTRCTNNQMCGAGRFCGIAEGETSGFCSCADDQDCSSDTRPGLCVGQCLGLGNPCLTNQDCGGLPCNLNNKACYDPSGATNTPCTDDATCPNVPLCGAFAGPGTRVCLTSPQGQPPINCATSADCLCIQGRCVNSDRPCTTGAQCVLRCQNGGCLIGSGCGPDEGLYCPDL